VGCRRERRDGANELISGRRVTEDKAPYATEILGRAKRMIHWLTENQQRVNEVRKGEVRFCFAGNSLAIHVTEVDSTA